MPPAPGSNLAKGGIIYLFHTIGIIEVKKKIKQHKHGQKNKVENSRFEQIVF